MDSEIAVTTLNELQIWINGKFALIVQAQDTSHTDLTNIRAKLHDLSNELTRITALNLPEKLSRLEETDRKLSADIDRFGKESAALRGVLATLKVLYTIVGVGLGSAVTLGIELYRVVK